MGRSFPSARSFRTLSWQSRLVVPLVVEVDLRQPVLARVLPLL